MRNFFLGIKYAVKKEVGGGAVTVKLVFDMERGKKKKFLRKKEKEKVKKS